MHQFKYRNNELYCEAVAARDIADEFGTPVYIYSRQTLIDHFQKIKQAFSSIRPLICFSMKANSSLAVVRLLGQQGAGMDVVSGGELYKALKAGINPKMIVYAGVGKSEREIILGIKAGIFLFNTESFAELGEIEQVAGRLNKKVNVSLRINPDIDPHTHRFITTGRRENKFGLDVQTAEEIFLRARIFSHLRLVGVHIHIGSQITDAQPFIVAIKRVSKLISRLRQKHVRLKYFNIGGGLGIVYRREKPQTAQKFAQAVLPLLKERGLKIILEPGRFIAGNSGIFVTKVLYIKRTRHKNFAIVDAGMNDLIRPALYGAYHEILPLCRQPAERKTQNYDIVGPICESTDFLAKNRTMPILYPRDLLAVMGTGAYGFSMASNYNSRPRAAEVLVNKDKFMLIRKRETYYDLVRQEIVPRKL